MSQVHATKVTRAQLILKSTCCSSVISVSSGPWALSLNSAHSFPAKRGRHNQPGKTAQQTCNNTRFPKRLSFDIY